MALTDRPLPATISHMYTPRYDGTRIRNLRERRGLHRTELARLTGISVSWLKYVEDNRRNGRELSAPLAHVIADALEVDITDLASGRPRTTKEAAA